MCQFPKSRVAVPKSPGDMESDYAMSTRDKTKMDSITKGEDGHTEINHLQLNKNNANHPIINLRHILLNENIRLLTEIPLNAIVIIPFED